MQKSGLVLMTLLYFISEFEQIPSDHLEGLYVWDSTQPNPTRTVISPGAGVADTDYILYVQASSQQTCWTVCYFYTLSLHAETFLFTLVGGFLIQVVFNTG